MRRFRSRANGAVMKVNETVAAALDPADWEPVEDSTPSPAPAVAPAPKPRRKRKVASDASGEDHS